MRAISVFFLLLMLVFAGCQSADKAYVDNVNQNLEWLVPDYIALITGEKLALDLDEKHVESRVKSAKRLLESSRKWKDDKTDK